MPEIIFDSLEAIPEGLREVAVEENGKMKINVVPKSKLDEFRNTNVKVVKERDDLAQALGRARSILGTEDFEEAEKNFGELRGIAQRVKDGELVENKGLDEAVAERTKEMRADYDGRITALQREVGAWKDKATTSDKKLKDATIDGAIRDAVLDPAIGANEMAMFDFLTRARSFFEVDEKGNLIGRDEKGEVQYGADGSTPMTPKEWVSKLKESAPHLFKGSSGGGAGGAHETRGLGGLTQAQINKLSPQDKIRLANGEKVAVPT